SHCFSFQQLNKRGREKFSGLFGWTNLRISLDANTLANLFIRNALKRQCTRSRFGAATRERDYRTCGEDRTQIELHFINDACIEGLTKNFAAALDQHARDLAFAQIFQDSSQRLASINQRSRSAPVGK